MKTHDFSRTTAFRHGAVLAVLLAAAPLAGCEPASSQPHGGMPPPEVAVVTVEPRDVPTTFEYTGQTAGRREVEVRARVTGILLRRNYREGQVVAAGQSLFTVDPAPFRAALERAQADVASAEARLGQARRNFARFKPLYEVRAISQRDFDDAFSAEAIAAADLKAALARR